MDEAERIPTLASIASPRRTTQLTVRRDTLKLLFSEPRHAEFRRNSGHRERNFSLWLRRVKSRRADEAYRVMGEKGHVSHNGSKRRRGGRCTRPRRGLCTSAEHRENRCTAADDWPAAVDRGADRRRDPPLYGAEWRHRRGQEDPGHLQG